MSMVKDAEKSFESHQDVGGIKWFPNYNYVNVVGITFHQGVLKRLWQKHGTQEFVIALVREPDNDYDKKAIAFQSDYGIIGHVGKEEIADWQDIFKEIGLDVGLVGICALHEGNDREHLIYPKVRIFSPR